VVRDAVIVGARCAGGTLALALARRGWDVVVVDRATFPSETISTHILYPNTLAELAHLGVLENLEATHAVPFLDHRIVGFGREVAGEFTAVDGFSKAAAPRRSALDKAIIDTAGAAGVETRFGGQVVDLIGLGTPADPVEGVVLKSGEQIQARWVLGADGHASTVAGRLGLTKERQLRGEVGFLFAYWDQVPDNGYATLGLGAGASLNRWAVEDGGHLLLVAGSPEITRGSPAARRRKYLELLRTFPEVVEPPVLDRATMTSDVIVAPESLMRGFFRQPAGPGWALLGDACYAKHPATGQGIGDAVEQALYLAAWLDRGGSRDAYEQWRELRAAGFYEWSFHWAQLPHPGMEPILEALESDPQSAQDLRDSFSRQASPSPVRGVRLPVPV
jgi:2-polyprenyl-6-methoxyphenol hydroxylase-like FAD-dependent oxidoreductase